MSQRKGEEKVAAGSKDKTNYHLYLSQKNAYEHNVELLDAYSAELKDKQKERRNNVVSIIKSLIERVETTELNEREINVIIDIIRQASNLIAEIGVSTPETEQQYYDYFIKATADYYRQYLPDEDEDRKLLPSSVLYNDCVNTLSTLKSHIQFIKSNKKASKLAGKNLNIVTSRLESLEKELNDNINNPKKLVAYLGEIQSLTRLIWTGEVLYEYELSRVQASAHATGVNTFIARITDPAKSQKFREAMHRVDDLEFRGAVGPEVLATALALTNQYIENPDEYTLKALNDFLESDDLPKDAHVKYYLKAMFISITTVAILASAIVASIYWPPAINLMEPVYQNIGHFIGGVLNTVPSIANIAVSSVTNTAQTTAFIIPIDGNAIPVWEAVAIPSVMVLSSLAGYKAAEKIEQLITDKQSKIDSHSEDSAESKPPKPSISPEEDNRRAALFDQVINEALGEEYMEQFEEGKHAARQQWRSELIASYARQGMFKPSSNIGNKDDDEDLSEAGDLTSNH